MCGPVTGCSAFRDRDSSWRAVLGTSSIFLSVAFSRASRLWSKGKYSSSWSIIEVRPSTHCYRSVPLFSRLKDLAVYAQVCQAARIGKGPAERSGQRPRRRLVYRTLTSAAAGPALMEKTDPASPYAGLGSPVVPYRMPLDA
jgi:hypothetical protein